jgi:hypothetical protein
MRLRRNVKGDILPALFARKILQPLRDSQIEDLTDLQQNYSESILVALDTEMSSHNQGVSEVGIAILRLNGQIVQPYEGIKQLHYEGGASAVTIQIRERTALPKEKMIGQVIRSEPKDVGSVIENILAKYKGRLILVGFDLYNEFKWITDECPIILSYFTAWLDVQEFAMQRREEFAAESESPNLNPPGLSDVLKAMDIRDERHCGSVHCAVNDALRSLIVLCGLASNPCLLSDMRPRPASRHSVQCYSRLTFKNQVAGVAGGAQHPFIARVSTAVNGGKLPPWSPDAVARHFAAHTDLKAVGLNWKTENHKVEGVRFWQLSFRTVESLERFIAEMNGSTVDAVKLLVCRRSMQLSS